MKIVERKYSPSVALSMWRAGLPPLLARVLAARGIRTANEVSGTLNDLIPYSRLKSCEETAKFLADLIVAQKRLLIVSDYDADGATACSIGKLALDAFGANVGYLIPKRLEHGYGLTPDIVKVAAELNPKPDYIITVDNGISSHVGINLANSLGIATIVTDHHLPTDVPPPAKFIVNPNQIGDTFPSKALAGCGTIWYLMWALQDELIDRGMPIAPGFAVENLLPIVAIGTVADVVPLDRNNRILVAAGLKLIHKGNHGFPGIEELAKVSGRNARELVTTDIAFGIGPHINAAGRLESMDEGVECLTTTDPQRAEELAKLLHEINTRRREVERDIIEEAVTQYTTEIDPLSYTIALHDDKWHQGVIGIVAGRIKERVWRPTFVLATGANGDMKGSGRSIPGFHLRDALDILDKNNPDILKAFGGHAMAAGVTVRAGKFEAFKKAFEEVARSMLSPSVLNQVVEVDGALEATDLNLDTVYTLRSQTWGQAFPEPMFCDVFDVVSFKKMGANGEHLRLQVAKGGQKFTAVKFRFEGEVVPDKVRLVYKIDANTFRNETSLQLMVEHLLPV